jgi:hypothetical protein
MRFRRLDDSAKLESDLAVLCKHSAIEVAQNSWTIPVGKARRKVRRPTDVLESDFFNPYHVSVVHGDLHGENILVMGADSRTFLIDFAHIGEHHVFLDYVVMEISSRFHLLGRYLRACSPPEVDGLISRWVQFEEWLALCHGANTDDPPWDVANSNDRLARLARLILWLRSNAWLHGFSDSYHNYYGGVGMTALTSPFLPDESPDQIRHAVRRALLSCAAFSLERVSRDVGTRPRRTPWDDALADTKRLDSFVVEILKANRSRIRGSAKGQLQAFCRLVGPEGRRTAAETAAPLCAALREDLPMLEQALEEYSNLEISFLEPALAKAFVAKDLLDQLELPEGLQHLKSKFSEWKASAWKAKVQS